MILLLKNDIKSLVKISAVSSSGEKSISLEHLVEWARANVHAEASEVLHSLILELHPAIAIDAVDSFRVCEYAVVQPEMTAGELLGRIEKDFDWVISCSRDGTTDESTDVAAEDPAYFWYRSSQAPRDVRRGLRALPQPWRGRGRGGRGRGLRRAECARARRGGVAAVPPAALQTARRRRRH